MIDLVVDRREMRDTIIRTLNFMMNSNTQARA
jgi:acetyl-CoA carboxylase beta subunit